MRNGNYFVYMVTNYKKTVLYTGVTNNLERRLNEHYTNKGNKKTFTGRYSCHYLIYFERHLHITHAIEREKQIKGWLREKKEDLINQINPQWKFLNDEINEN